jgi:hypothetical protein
MAKLPGVGNAIDQATACLHDAILPTGGR